MRQIGKLLCRLRKELHPVSLLAIKLGIAQMICFYIVGITSRFTAPYVPNYFGAMALFRGCLEAAPASLASGVCAGLIGDLMLGGKSGKDKGED